MAPKKMQSLALKNCREVEIFSQRQQLASIGKLATSWPELQFTFRMNVLKPELLVGCRHFTFRMNVQSHVEGQMEHWTDMQPWGCRGDNSPLSLSSGGTFNLLQVVFVNWKSIAIQNNSECIFYGTLFVVKNVSLSLSCKINNSDKFKHSQKLLDWTTSLCQTTLIHSCIHCCYFNCILTMCFVCILKAWLDLYYIHQHQCPFFI